MRLRGQETGRFASRGAPHKAWFMGGLVALTTVLSSCAPPDDGRLVVYTAGPRPLAEAICKAFEAAQSVRVELFTATTGQIMAKLEAEKYHPRADVVLLAAETPMLGLKQAGRLHSYRPQAIPSFREGWADPDATFHATGAAAVGIAFRVGQADPNATWWGVLEEGVQTGDGRIVMPSPSRSGTAGDFLLALHAARPDTFWQTFKNARRRGFEIVGANSQAVTGLSMGAYDAVFCAADYIICREIERGEQLEVFFPPEGSLYVYRPVAILESSRRKPLAEQFIEFIFAPEAQAMLAGQHLLPAREEVPLSEVRARFPIPSPLPFDAAEAIRSQKEIVRRFQYEIERAVIVR